MDSFWVLLFSIHVIIFFFAQLMPNRKWFAIYTLLFGGLLAYGYFENEYVMRQPEYQGSPGDGLGLAMLYLVVTAFCIGIITRAITLYLKYKNYSFWLRFIITVLGFLSIIPIVYAPQLLSDWKHREPSAECNFNTVTLNLETAKFTMASLPILSFYTGDGNDPYSNEVPESNYYFHGNQSIRKFCRDFNNGKAEIHANAVAINFFDLDREMTTPNFKAVCNDKNTKFPHELCENSYEKLYYPQKIYLYVAGKYNASRMFGGENTYEEFTKIKNSLVIDKNHHSILYDGTHYYWMESKLKSPNGNPVVVKCYESGEKFHCETDYKLSGNLQIIYRMLLNKNSFEDDLVKYHDKVHSFLRITGVE
mgnify:CR=1 FL=1